MRVLGRALTSLAPLLGAGWAALALHDQLPVAPLLRMGAVAGWGLFAIAALILVWRGQPSRAPLLGNARGEDLSLYRVQMPPAAMRSLFLAHVAEAESLQRTPRFYDTLAANCITIVYQMAQRIVDGLPMGWRLPASGYLPEYVVHGVGALAPGVPLEALRAAGRITLRAQAGDADPQFSRAIRVGIPGMEAAPR
ncbi:MAG: DUF4105 domain-containing protein [Xenophilus sp.]